MKVNRMPLLPLLLLVVSVLQLAGCATNSSRAKSLTTAGVVEIPVPVIPTKRNAMAEGARVVIAEIEGNCGREVEDALIQRLVNNHQYDVLTRDNLDVVIGESDIGWEGRFDTKTVSRLGRLLGAQAFIFGRVLYCDVAASSSPDNEIGVVYKVTAALQIIDSETGRVILADTSEGSYIPRLAPFGLVDTELLLEEAPSAADGKNLGTLKRIFRKIREVLKELFAAKQEVAAKAEPVNYQILKAAGDLAAGFADRFFLRPTWEEVEMWASYQWGYGKAVRYVRLGDCDKAVDLLESAAANELGRMQETDIAKHLHNYGVALLCADRPADALRKLRLAYQVGYNKTTLKMMGVAAKISEWDLAVERSGEPEVELLLERAKMTAEERAEWLRTVREEMAKAKEERDGR